MTSAPQSHREFVKNPPRHAIRYILLIACFAFLGGVGVAVLLGPSALRGIPFGLAIYATVCAALCTVFFGYILTRAVHR